MYHEPVLLKESIEGLRIYPEGVYVDATFGGGGHSQAILNRLDRGRLIAFDQDPSAKENLPDDQRLILIPHNFKYLKNYLRLHNILEINGLLADLGVSSHQFDNPEKGFSTRFDGALDMRMDPSGTLSAHRVINTYDQDKLTDLFRTYGEIKNPHQLSRAVCENRDLKEIENTGDLVKIALKNAPRNKENKYLAQVFQAIRIEVNEEISALKTMLLQAGQLIVPQGTLVIISYHSLEDRLVKNFIRSNNFEGKLEKDFYGNPKVLFRPVNRRPIIPSEQEIERNKRARSAKMRIAEKI